MRELTARTFCRMCFGRCSLLVTVENGRIIAVAADKDAPRGRDSACARGLALPEILNHPDRLLFPLRRKGARGSGNWKRVSWEEALDYIAGKLRDLKQTIGPECVALGMGDPKGMEIAFAQRLASAFGTPNITTPGHICHMPGELASNYTFGAPSHPDSENHPHCIVVWGSNPPHTRNGLSPLERKSALSAGAKLIVIDPRKTTPASRADVWLKPRPGSDGILALGMIKVIIEEQLYDEGFVSSWTVGFDRLVEHVETYSLKSVEEVTWIHQERIREAARLYAETRPAVIEWGNALDHTEKSFQTCRAICILRALTGNLDVPGGEILTTPVPLSRSGQFMLLRQFPRKPDRMAGSEFKLAARSAFIARQSLVKAILDEEPHPVKAALFFGTNPLLSYPDAARTYQALMKLEFMVVADLFMTPTASLADVVLPVSFIGESDELCPYPAAGGFILAYPRIVEPPGECWPDIKIINQLARKLGLQDHFWADEREALDFILEPSGLSFEDLKERRYLEGDKGYRKYEESGFRTPSGKVEIYSGQLESLGYSPLPLYRELCQSPALSEEYPLLLTNAKERHFSHSAHRNIAKLREMTPDPVVQLNPATARRLGVEEGSWVFIETPKGKIRQKLLLDEALDPRVVVASYGWWFPEKRASELFDWRKSNINIITDSAPPYDPAIGSLNLRGIPCRVVGDLADRMP